MNTTRDLLRSQFQLTHRLLDTIMADVTDPVANSVPAGQIDRIAVIYAHAVQDEDYMLNAMVQGKPLLFETGGWAIRTGVPMPAGPTMTPEWRAAVKMNLAAFKQYAQAVYSQTDLALNTLSDAAWARQIQGPMGSTSAFDMFSTIGLYHVAEHSGEIAALKGVQDMKGLPF